MDKYTEYLDKRVMDQAYEIGVLRGTLKGILNQHKSKFHPDAIKSIEEVLKRTDDKPKEEVPTFHNGATQVEKYTGEVM